MASKEIVKKDPEAFHLTHHLGVLETEMGRRSAFLSVTYDESGNVTHSQGTLMSTRSIWDRRRDSDIDGEVISDISEIEA